MAQSQENKKTFYIVLIIILLLLNGFFIYKHISTSKELAITIEKKNELDSLYKVTKSDLEATTAQKLAFEGKNVELDSLLSSREKELTDALANLDQLKKEGNTNKRRLNEALETVKRLQAEKEDYLAKISVLTSQVEFLTSKNDSLNTQTQAQRAENEQLANQNRIYAQKVAIGSLLIPENIVVEGLMEKSKERYYPTSKAKKVQKLGICFDVPENKVADTGTKTMVLRILNPQGATIWMTSNGSGLFTTTTGEEEKYTIAKQFDYNNQKARVCTDWKQVQGFGSGDYTVLFYQDGHELASHRITLK